MASPLSDTGRAPLRGPTYRTIFALLYGLGLRVGEVARLTVGDVDGDRRLLVIRKTKFGKSRLVPFGPRLGRTLEDYLALRRVRTRDLDAMSPLFTFTRRGAIHPGTISQTFYQLVPQLALVVPEGVASPRLHDLRHAFAVGTLLRWYRLGLDPRARLLHLSTFLGHVDPASTAVYLTITPALLQEASQGLCRFRRTGAPGGPAMTRPILGALVQAFFLDYLAVQKGLRPASIKTYRDAIRLFLTFMAADRRCALTRLSIDDLTLDRVLRFLSSLETDRHNRIRTRNHRRAVLVVFFEFLARRLPEQLGVSQQVAAIPVKRVAPP